MNLAVGAVIEEELEREQEYYESDTHDKLKTPPHVFIKRLERD